MALSTQTATELAQEQVAKVLVKPPEDVSVFLPFGARIFDTKGALRIPRMGGPTTDPGWTGDHEQIPEREAHFDELHLLPDTMKSVVGVDPDYHWYRDADSDGIVC